MKLPIPFTHKKDDHSEYYLTLLLTDEKASAVILKEELGKMAIIGQDEEYFHTSVERISQDDLIDAVDKAISRAEEILPPSIETHKTIFGVKANWVEGETKKIKKDYLSKLKKVCDALDLSPIGFMVITEAIAHLLQEEEGAPLSAIIAEIGRKQIWLTLLRGGKIAETTHGPMQESAFHTIDLLLKNFTIAVLPARIIILPAAANEKLSQEFITYQWSKGLPFLHVPHTVVLPPKFDAKAVTFGAATQLGFTVVRLTHDIPPSSQKEPEREAEELRHQRAEVSTPDHQPTHSLKNTENFGFVMDQDIAKINPPAVQKNEDEAEETKKHDKTHNNTQYTEMVDEDAFPKSYLSDNLADIQTEEDEREEYLEERREKPQKEKRPLTAFLSKLTMPKVRIPGMKIGANTIFIKILVLIIMLLVIAVGLFFFYMNSVHATILLTMKPKMIELSNQITLSTTAPNDFSKNIIAARSITASVQGSASTDATGKKDIGDKAKGTVTVYNTADTTQSLNSGAQIKSEDGGLMFVLDKSVTVSSASGDIFSGTTPGTSDTTVTANDIGTDYNLPSGTKFSISGNTTMAAKNGKAFLGGTKKQVTVVSKDDVVKLKNDLPKSLEEQGKNAITAKVGSGTLLPDITSSGIEKPSIDKQIGDQTQSVKLTGTVDFVGMAYNNDDVLQFAKALLQDKYSQDVSFSDNSIKSSVSDIKQDGKTATAKLTVQAGLLPKINTSDVVARVQDKSLSQAKDVLTTLPQIDHSEIQFSPNIPFLPSLLPKLPKNLTVVMKTD